MLHVFSLFMALSRLLDFVNIEVLESAEVFSQSKLALHNVAL